MNTHTLNVRINKQTKLQAQKIVEKMGLDLSSAIKLFLNRVILTKSIPFEIQSENGFRSEVEASMLKEVEYMNKYGKRYATLEDALRELNR